MVVSALDKMSCQAFAAGTSEAVEDVPAAQVVVLDDEEWLVSIDTSPDALLYGVDTHRGALYATKVIGVPVTFVNVGTNVNWPYFYPRFLGPDGVEQAEAGPYDELQKHFSDSARNASGVEPGESVSTYAYFIDEGPGTYALVFSDERYLVSVVEFDAPDAVGEPLGDLDVLAFLKSPYAQFVQFDEALYILDADPDKLTYFYDDTPVYTVVYDAMDDPIFVRDGTPVIGVPTLQVCHVQPVGWAWDMLADYFGPSSERQLYAYELQRNCPSSLASVGRMRDGAVASGYVCFVDEGDGVYSIDMRGHIDGEWTTVRVSVAVPAS